jgi:hypothetical protein
MEHYLTDAQAFGGGASDPAMTAITTYGTLYVYAGLAVAAIVFLVCFFAIWRKLAQWMGGFGVLIGFVPAAAIGWFVAIAAGALWPLAILLPLIVLASQRSVRG